MLSQYLQTIVRLRQASYTAALPNGVIEWSEVVSCRPDYDIAKGKEKLSKEFHGL